MTQTKRVTEPKELFNYLDSDQYVVSEALMVNDETVQIQYTNKDEFVEE